MSSVFFECLLFRLASIDTPPIGGERGSRGAPEFKCGTMKKKTETFSETVRIPLITPLIIVKEGQIQLEHNENCFLSILSCFPASLSALFCDIEQTFLLYQS